MKPLLLTFNLLCGMDAAETHRAIVSHNGIELALPTQNPWAIDAIVAGQAVGLTLLSTRIHREHPRVAKTIVILATVARGLAVAHNLRELMQ